MKENQCRDEAVACKWAADCGACSTFTRAHQRTKERDGERRVWVQLLPW